MAIKVAFTFPVAARKARSQNVSRSSLIGQNDQWSTWSILTLAATLGMASEKSPVGKALTSPVCAMLCTAVMVNSGVLPARNVALGDVQKSVAMLTSPLLLLNANLRKVLKESGTGMLTCFVLSAISVCLGGAGAFLVVSALKYELNWKLCAALIAKNVGGGLNYIAVCATLGLPGDVIASGLTIDNVVGLIYFPGISYLSKVWVGREKQMLQGSTQRAESRLNEGETRFMASELATALAFASVIVATSKLIALRTRSTASMPIATAIAVGIASLCPALIEPFRIAGEELGKVLLYIYFASAGAGGGTVASAANLLPLLGFCLIMYSIHVLVLLACIRFFKLEPKEAFLASNASIGGPATASAMAVAKGWTKHVVPAVLVGNLGNAIATFLALSIGQNVLSRL
ncbi:hypothetical protein NDN08_003164 [Rhodosorus marinus]|uniref:DUF819 domain-containing protein n=1 Tax=Rhodosorus marinus TaxID=101924 RepID=A0AAV8UVW9_9RHOD|nr:hypothetical protein NDN08_003164 [Rhodosorus marinus]